MAQLIVREIAWWEAQPERQTCRDCKREDSKAYVQPQKGGYALCGDCIGRLNSEARARHKAALTAMPRCEACGKHRGTWNVGRPSVLLCGRCNTKARAYANREAAKLGGMALFMPLTFSREDILAAARQTTEERGL